MTTNILEKPILYTEDIAEILRITRNTIQSKRWKESSGCPLRKKGKCLSALRDDFWKWYKDNG
ncbi:MAG: hypothetical protein COV71_05880 [Candidatus Omnitrophica bacterium CG11_big_fil_rev_8_21_14_0_20_41_12]|nr:MAG: hypothetical protein COV71_05880 [Candidatus Omnitrophica bacterium CG11_big_fil_rev_8_21_14_0_20_41_12]